MIHLFPRKKNTLRVARASLSFSPGQSLVETLLAVAVLTIAIVGALTLLSQVTNAAMQARERFVAANLAQEGLEFVQDIRTTNWIQNQNWLTNLSQGAYCSDFMASPPTLTPSASACPLFLNASNEYVLTTGTATPFSRLITLTPGTDNDAGTTYLDVQSKVTWDNASHSLTAEERLYNWY